MSVKIMRTAATADPIKDPIAGDTTQSQREVTVDGYTFHFGLNERKNFLDDGVGAAVAAFSSADTIVESTVPDGQARS